MKFNACMLVCPHVWYAKVLYVSGSYGDDLPILTASWLGTYMSALPAVRFTMHHSMCHGGLNQVCEHQSSKGLNHPATGNERRVNDESGKQNLPRVVGGMLLPSGCIAYMMGILLRQPLASAINIRSLRDVGAPVEFVQASSFHPAWYRRYCSGASPFVCIKRGKLLTRPMRGSYQLQRDCPN